MSHLKYLWFLRNWQAWAVLAMGILTAIIARQGWIVTLGVIGYLLILLFDILSGGSLDRSSFVRLATAEQENRALRAEHARLVGGLKELQARSEALEARLRQLAQELQAAQAENEKLKGQSPSARSETSE